MEGRVTVEILDGKLDIGRAYEAVAGPGQGAVDLFAGAVRDNHLGQEVSGITYDVHKGLGEKVLREICAEAAGLWPGTVYYAAHYHGELPVGGISVLIAVSAAHRAESFEGCRYVIEEIKKRAPVWKQEHYPGGRSAWLPGHSLVAEAGAGTDCCGKCHGAGGG